MNQTVQPGNAPRLTPTNRPQQQQQPQQQLDPNNEIVQGLNNKAAILEELMLMGFEQNDAKQALECAFFNKERAIDYLLNVL